MGFLGYFDKKNSVKANNVCLIKIRSKLSSVLLLCLLRFFMKQTLHYKDYEICRIIFETRQSNDASEINSPNCASDMVLTHIEEKYIGKNRWKILTFGGFFMPSLAHD